MKTKKQLYDPPVVETVTLQVESFVCQSEDLGSGLGLNQGYFDDFSSDLMINIL